MLFFSLLAFWILVSERLDVQHLLVGSACALLLTWFWRDFLLDVVQRRDLWPARLLFSVNTLRYGLDLCGEIVTANLNIARIVLTPSLPISPVLVSLRTKLSRDLIRVVYANSITLTPGTISVSLSGDKLVVHALTRAAAAGVEGWKIEEDLLKLERGLGGG